MGLALITGYAGVEHITANNIGVENAMIFGTGNYVFDFGQKLAFEILTNNSIRIKDGDGVINGRHFSMPTDTFEDVTIANGSQNMFRNDLIVARYTLNSNTAIESTNLVVIKGTEADTEEKAIDPIYNDGSILDGETIVDFPLYRVHLNGLTLESVTPLFSIFSNYNKQIAEMKANFSDGVDSIYNAIVSAGATPKSKALADVVASIPDIVKNKRVGTATAAQVLTGYTFSNNGNTGLSGGMANRGAVSQTIKAGGSYTIPSGYHNGSGKVSASNIAISKKADIITFPSIDEDRTLDVSGLTVGRTYMIMSAMTSIDITSGGTKITTFQVNEINPPAYLACRVYFFRATATSARFKYWRSSSNPTDTILVELS